MNSEDARPEGMEQEFLDFLNRYQPVLRRVCRMYADSPEDREDLFQETVYQLWRSYPSFRGESSRETWVYRVACNTAISALRKKTKPDRNVAMEEDLAQVPSPDPRGGEAGRIDLLHRMIRRLNQVERTLVLLYLEDLSYKDLANILGLSERNVGVKLSRIRVKLQSFAKELE